MIEIIYTESALRFDVMVWVETYLLWNIQEADDLLYTEIIHKHSLPAAGEKISILCLSCVISFVFWAFPKVANLCQTQITDFWRRLRRADPVRSERYDRNSDLNSASYYFCRTHMNVPPPLLAIA